MHSKRKLAATAFCGAIMGLVTSAASAWASVVYTYDITSISNYNPTPYLNGGSPNTPLSVSFSLSDAAVASGSFSLTESGPISSGGSPDISSQSSIFDYFNFSGVQVTPTAPRDVFSLRVQLAFDGAGGITSYGLSFNDGTVGLETNLGTLGGFGRDEIGTDDARCGGPSGGQCFITGSFSHSAFAAPVPEPTSLALLVAGLASLGVAARRKAA